MEQVQAIVVLALAILLLAVLMRMHGRLEAFPDFDGTPGERSVHRVAIPLRIAVAMVSMLVLLRTAEAAQESRAALVLGLSLLPVFAYATAYCWQFRAVLRGHDLSVMTPAFRTRDYDLTRLTEVHDDLPGACLLRFQGGQTAWLVKYLSGQSTLSRSIDEARPYY